MRLPVFRSDDTRSARTRLGRLVSQTSALWKLPVEVRRFYLLALWTAWRRHDQYSFDVVTRPRDLIEVLGLAHDADRVVELGTATAWTTIGPALARCSRHVISYAAVDRPQRQMYLQLIPPSVRDRITFVNDIGRSGPR